MAVPAAIAPLFMFTAATAPPSTMFTPAIVLPCAMLAPATVLPCAIFVPATMLPCAILALAIVPPCVILNADCADDAKKGSTTPENTVCPTVFNTLPNICLANCSEKRLAILAPASSGDVLLNAESTKSDPIDPAFILKTLSNSV